MDIRIPISRFRRELNQWIRYIKNNPTDVVFITRNNKDVCIFTSPEWYEKYLGVEEDGI